VHNIQCVPKNVGDCGEGKQVPVLRCYKTSHDKSVDVDLVHCDENEISKTLLAYSRQCTVPCEHYKWRKVESEVKIKRKKIPKVKMLNCRFEFRLKFKFVDDINIFSYIIR
jgi:hypothetical protein